MSSDEFNQLSTKIDRLSDKIDSQWTRLDDGKLDRNEYLRAHEALEGRVLLVEQKIEAETKAADSVHDRIELASSTRYDKITDQMTAKFDRMDTKFEALDVKIVGLKDTMNTRFDTMRDQASATRRGTVQWAIGLLVGLLGGGGIGSLLWYLTHLAHP